MGAAMLAVKTFLACLSFRAPLILLREESTHCESLHSMMETIAGASCNSAFAEHQQVQATVAMQFCAQRHMAATTQHERRQQQCRQT